MPYAEADDWARRKDINIQQRRVTQSHVTPPPTDDTRIRHQSRLEHTQ